MSPDVLLDWVQSTAIIALCVAVVILARALRRSAEREVARDRAHTAAVLEQSEQHIELLQEVAKVIDATTQHLR